MKKKIFAFLLALVLPLAGCAALTGSDQPAGYRQVSAQEAMEYGLIDRVITGH